MDWRNLELWILVVKEHHYIITSKLRLFHGIRKREMGGKIYIVLGNLVHRSIVDYHPYLNTDREND
jgi:hypothetical protein